MSLRKNASGFTLVELRMVIAIIGILASIAIPNFPKDQARARQREVSIGLAAVYTAERSFRSECNPFTGCPRQAGDAPVTANRIRLRTSLLLHGFFCGGRRGRYRVRSARNRGVQHVRLGRSRQRDEYLRHACRIVR